jgi:hypothetical protein
MAKQIVLDNEKLKITMECPEEAFVGETVNAVFEVENKTEKPLLNLRIRERNFDAKTDFFNVGPHEKRKISLAIHIPHDLQTAPEKFAFDIVELLPSKK